MELLLLLGRVEVPKITGVESVNVCRGIFRSSHRSWPTAEVWTARFDSNRSITRKLRSDTRIAAIISGRVRSRFTSHQKCTTPAIALAYTNRWSASQRFPPSQRIEAAVDVSARGNIRVHAVIPAVIKGRL